MTVYAQPGTPGSVITFQEQYENFIGGQWVPPVEGQYFDVTTPVTGQAFTRAPRSTAPDVELALDAAWEAFPAWSKLSATQRAEILWKIGDRIDENLEKIAVADTWDNGKPVRETLAADIPLAADHFRYFAAAIRAQESNTNEVNEDLVAYHFQEPLGVVGQIIPWNFPILMAAWKIAPALAAGNTIVLKPASETPVSLLEFVKSFEDLLPAGVLNIVNGAGSKVGNALANSTRIRKIAFTGSTSVGRSIAQSAANLIIPATLELGGKSPNVFFADVADKDDAFYQKALEGFSLFQLNQGEICTCPSRALVQESIYEKFLTDAVARVESAIQGNPLDTNTQVGAQVSENQMNTILGYIKVGKEEGAEVLTGGERNILEGDLAGGFYVKPTVFKGQNSMRVFQEEIFGPVLSVTSFTDFDDAISIANDTIYGLGAGVWSRSGRIQYKAGRAIQAGRVWTNTYHNYPAGAAFGGYKESGIGRETHKMVLDAYQQTKNLLVSYSEEPQGLY